MKDEKDNRCKVTNQLIKEIITAFVKGEEIDKAVADNPSDGKDMAAQSGGDTDYPTKMTDSLK